MPENMPKPSILLLMSKCFVVQNAFAALPSQPEIIYNSIRVHNWDTLKFSWKVNRHDDVYNTEYTAWYRFERAWSTPET